jgi:hypothetical protein
VSSLFERSAETLDRSRSGDAFGPTAGAEPEPEPTALAAIALDDDAARRWHAPVSVYRVEGVKAADSARRSLVKNLPTKDGRFQIDEQRKTAKQVFFEWLERLGQELDFADEGAWLRLAATLRE